MAEEWEKYLEEGCETPASFGAEAALKEATIIKLPAKNPVDRLLRLEQNLGCELPVTCGNRNDIHAKSIRVVLDDETAWQLTRTADSLLPGPEHYRYWLWALDRWQAAFKAGYREAPRVKFTPKELFVMFGGPGRVGAGTWYDSVDEGFQRFSRLVVSNKEAFYMGDKRKRGVLSQTLGTLCNYSSWRDEEGAPTGVASIQPGPLIWGSICRKYLKAVDWQPIRQLDSYVAQRLLVYLSKHCRPNDEFKISLARLAPKIPMTFYRARAAKEHLKPHHEALIRVGFLAGLPEFEGRGARLSIIYRRA